MTAKSCTNVEEQSGQYEKMRDLCKFHELEAKTSLKRHKTISDNSKNVLQALAEDLI